MVVRRVPVHEVRYTWRGKGGRLWLVGSDDLVHGQEEPLTGALFSRTVSEVKVRLDSLLHPRPGFRNGRES